MSRKIWRELIIELAERNVRFELINNVLSFEGLPQGVEGLWYWFGEVKIVRDGQRRAGDMDRLADYNFKEDGIELIAKTGDEE